LNKEEKIRISLIIFAILVAASALSMYHTYQQPASEIQTVILGIYWHNALYDYAAELKPNIIYENKTILKPGEGTLYTAITNKINLSFTYSLTSNPPPETANITLKTLTIEIESPEKWIKTLSETSIKEIFKLKGSLNFTLEIACAKIRELVDKIDKEIGTYTSTYNIYIMPEIQVNARISTKTIEETYAPKLTIAFKTGTEKGSYISIENLNQRVQKKITETRRVEYPEIQTWRNISSAATALTSMGLVASGLLYMKNRQPIGEETAEKIEEIVSEYEDIMVKTIRPPPETQITIELETLEDLTKIAEILAKPILHSIEGEEHKEHIFYIIDDDIKYVTKLKLE